MGLLDQKKDDTIVASPRSKKSHPVSTKKGSAEKSTLEKAFACGPYQGALIEEEPLLIRIEGQPYAVIMRTPGEEIAHGAGFCLAEGLVNEPGDLGTIGYCEESEGNVVTVTLVPERRREVSELLARRGFMSTTSCGICGKELIKDLRQILSPCKDHTHVSLKTIYACVSQLPRHQALYKSTGSSHAAMLFDAKGQVLGFGEDVGRHNALDKAIGKVFMAGRLKEARLAVLSSRISYELVQKGARAGIPMLVGVSRPTALAVRLGRQMNMTLTWMSKRDGLFVFCGEKRITSCH